jgi:hypothetical protein
VAKKPYKQDPPALKAKEEKLGDQDGDNEVGEDPAHAKKVKAAQKNKKSGFIPFQKGKAGGKKGKK